MKRSNITSAVLVGVLIWAGGMVATFTTLFISPIVNGI